LLCCGCGHEDIHVVCEPPDRIGCSGQPANNNVGCLKLLKLLKLAGESIEWRWFQAKYSWKRWLSTPTACKYTADSAHYRRRRGSRNAMEALGSATRDAQDARAPRIRLSMQIPVWRRFSTLLLLPGASVGSMLPPLWRRSGRLGLPQPGSAVCPHTGCTRASRTDRSAAPHRGAGLDGNSDRAPAQPRPLQGGWQAGPAGHEPRRPHAILERMDSCACYR